MSSAAPRQPLTLLTFVLQEHHCTILEDWITFFDHSVSGIVVHVGAAPEIRKRLEELASRFELDLRILGEATAQQTTLEERHLLADQFDAVDHGYGCVVRLDTLPYRAPGIAWQDESFAQMDALSACFITGSTQPYRADRQTTNSGHLLTQRLSNCFLVIAPETWRLLQTGTPDSEARYGRFLVEGAAEDYLFHHGLWGLRLVNRPDWRIFHCQEWGPRLLHVRDAFHAGRTIERFMRGYQDDLPRESFYMYPKTPLHRRLRIFLGRWRRKLLGRTA